MIYMSAESGRRGFCGWIVSPRASIATNCSILRARVSGFLALAIL
jgi:hypothetical protein